MAEQHLVMFLVIFGAAAVPFAARRFRVPSAALEIVYGMILFNTLLTHRPEWFLLLKEIGLIYLMFIAGMELDVRHLLQSGKLQWYLAIPLLSFAVTPPLFLMAGYPFFLGVAVAMVSAGIVVPVLKEAAAMQTPLGRHIIGIALSGELLSIVVLTFIDTFHKYGWSAGAAHEILKLVLFLALAFLVLKLLYLAAWWHPERVEKVMESEDPVEEGIRAVVSIAFAGGLLAAAAGAEPILGSFMAGVIFSYVFKSKGRFEEKVNAVGFGFFTPFFFIGVGATFDVSLLSSLPDILLALVLALMVLVSNLAPFLFLRPLALNRREAGAISLLLSAPLSLLVVAGALGAKMGLITASMNSALVLAALVASILYPSLFRLLARGLSGEREAG